MIDKGWISLHRQIQENPLWTCNEPFDSRSAWIDLLLSANHSDGEIYINGQFKEIKRGQFHTSQLKLAERWHWKRDKVERYLAALQKVGMITFTSSKSGSSRGTTITIVKYEVFQDTVTSTPTSHQHQTGHQTNINSDINNTVNNENNVNKKSSHFVPPSLEEVAAYCSDRKNGIDPQSFIDFYVSKGWMIGKNKMKDWKAAVRTWEQRETKTKKKEDEIDAKQRAEYGNHWTDHFLDN